VPRGQTLPLNDNAIFIGAGPRFFETMQTLLSFGREFTERDTANTSPVAIINEAFVRHYFPDQSPIGQYISTKASVGTIPRGQPRDLEIIGVVKNTNTTGLRKEPYPTVYVPYAQLTGDFSATLEIRARGSIASVAESVRKVLQPKIPSVPVEVRPLSAQVEAAMVKERMVATLAGAFAGLSLIVASIGLYGLLAYSVARRAKEMGIRMALGAQRMRVIIMVMKSAIGLVSIGIALGLPIAWAATSSVESMLFGLQPTDSR